MKKLTILTIAALLLMPLAVLRAVTLGNLGCECFINPLGIDTPKPRLSWVIESGKRGELQTAYEVLVASTPELLAKDKGDLWDSGRVVSDQSIQIEYAGQPLESRMECHWKVRVWDKAGKASDWAKPARWTMGLLQAEDWSAKWITASKWFMPPNVRPNGLVVSAGGWADVDLRASFSVDAINLYFTDTNSAPTRFLIEAADEPQFYQPQSWWTARRKIFNPPVLARRCSRWTKPCHAISVFGLQVCMARTGRWCGRWK